VLDKRAELAGKLETRAGELEATAAALRRAASRYREGGGPSRGLGRDGPPTASEGGRWQRLRVV
jgi:hypothetical protein